MFISYPEALQYLYDNLPIFQRIGSSAYKPDLSNTRILCEALDNPQLKFKSIHVAGTNGKGSSSHMLASILQSAGYKTGLYTSPHLKEFTERIRINGVEIRKEHVIKFVNHIRPTVERIKPSFFEITVAMAFDYFAIEKIDVAVIEVGLGGRLDSTNIITPIVSLITNIGWDHTDLLGNTLEKIAFEKAGIIKHAIPVIISERQPEVENVFIEKATSEHAPIVYATDVYQIEDELKQGQVHLNIKKHDVTLFTNLILPLQGIYQRKNIAGVLSAVDVLNDSGFVITQDALKNGLNRVIENTNLKGRWQKIADKPLTICDTGHNVDGIREVVKQIRLQSYNHLHIILGMVKDKDITKVLELLPKEARYYFCQAKIPRALEASALADKAKEFLLKGVVIEDVNEAIFQAKQVAGVDDFIFIGGSTFVVAEIENL